MNRANTMRLNNAVEEAIGSGDGHHHRVSSSGFAHSASIDSGAAAPEERDSPLKFNHAEDEHYGMSHHQG